MRAHILPGTQTHLRADKSDTCCCFSVRACVNIFCFLALSSALSTAQPGQTRPNAMPKECKWHWECANLTDIASVRLLARHSRSSLCVSFKVLLSYLSSKLFALPHSTPLCVDSLGNGHALTSPWLVTILANSCCTGGRHTHLPCRTPTTESWPLSAHSESDRRVISSLPQCNPCLPFETAMITIYSTVFNALERIARTLVSLSDNSYDWTLTKAKTLSLCCAAIHINIYTYIVFIMNIILHKNCCCNKMIKKKKAFAICHL